MPRRPFAPLLLLALALTAPARAGELLPFEIQYRLYISRIPTPIKADLTLRRMDEPDHYEMELEVRSLLMHNREYSRFEWNECEPRTETYTHTFKGFGKRRDHHMTFDWSVPEVVSRSGGKKEATLAIVGNTLDELTMLLKARCVLGSGDREYHVTSVYGGRFREHWFQVVDTEVLDTPLGEVETLVVVKKRDRDSERHTVFWVAPAWDYLLVKARHVENRALFGELVMRDYDGPVLSRTAQK